MITRVLATLVVVALGIYVFWGDARAARSIVSRRFTSSYDYALQTMSDVPYGRWAEYDPADTMRFYALPRSKDDQVEPAEDPQSGTDWRFLNELKRELKG